MTKDIITKIIPSVESEIPILKQHLANITVYEKSSGKWYIRSFDRDKKEKLVFSTESGKTAPEEIVRQLFLYELINVYKYPASRIQIETNVSFGLEKKRADIIVYQEDNVTPWIVVEVKAPREKNNVQQLKSYLNAEGSPIGVGINGKDITILYRPYPKEFDNTLPDIPFEFEYQQVKSEDQPATKIKDVVLNRDWTLSKLNQINEVKQFDLRSIIVELEELVLANSGVDSFHEVFKLIYSKLFDEFEARTRTNQQLKFRQYVSPTTTHREISNLFSEAKKQWKDVFEPSDKIKLTPEHLDVCVGKLTEVKLYGANLRIIDEAFEYLVPEVSKGKKGQYFTPRVIIDACVSMLNPGRREYVIDPACGSSGFLVHTMEYVWQKYGLVEYQDRSSYASKYLWGIDFDERSTKISRAIMLIAGDGRTHIYRENSLVYSKWNNRLKSSLEDEELASEGFKQLNFDIVMTNPPFAGDIKEQQLIKQYGIIKKQKASVERHYLFIERTLDLLKPGGRMAIVLPQGIFQNAKEEKDAREYIMERARILAVIGLHGNSFKPHTGTKTSILFVRKWQQGESPMEDYPIFFAVSKNSFKDNSGRYIYLLDEEGVPVHDANGNPIYQTDLFDIASAFIEWGKSNYAKGDKHFSFLIDDNN